MAHIRPLYALRFICRFSFLVLHFAFAVMTGALLAAA